MEECNAEEINSLCTNETWDVVELPEGEHVVGARWVYTVKLGNHNNVVKYKARYVAKRYAQRWGIDYDQTFAPTATSLNNPCIITNVCTV